MAEVLLADATARARIGTDLGATLFVEAGAGTGKTSALVARVVALVTSGRAELASIAAITFTEKAAAELRHRLRDVLGAGAAAADADPVEAARCRRALDQLDSAAIGTLHAFARRLLSEHPLESGLPPRVEVLDEVTSGVESERRWAEDLDVLLADGSLRRPLLLLFAVGARDDALRALAAAFEQSWDLVAERVQDHPAEPPPVAGLLARTLAGIDAVVARRSECTAPDDGLARRLDDLEAHAAWLRSLDDELEVLEALGPQSPRPAPSGKVARTGRKGAWPDIDAVRAEVGAACAALAAVPVEVGTACIVRIAAALRARTLAAAAERRASGRLTFHDLLVLARALLRDPRHGPAVRARLHDRYAHLLLDEFQDTDPVQVELAVRIAARDPADPAAGSAHWAEVPVRDGQLFVVGDPKQSIYRFRRADISTFLAAQERFGADGGGLVRLTSNFRTTAPLVGWVNHVFAALLAEPPDTEVPVPSQPAYAPLVPTRDAAPGGPPVAVVGRAPLPRGTPADEIRRIEAGAVARAVRQAWSQGWSVADGEGGWRPCRLADVCILVPARTSLPFLHDALDAAGIPHRTESSSLVYATRAVRDLLMVLRAADDPTDQLRVVAALRTPLLACGDDDLVRYRVGHGGSWDPLAHPPASLPADDPVVAGLAYLRAVHERRNWVDPSVLVEQVARERRAFELAFVEGRPRDVWRRLRFVLDQARAWCDAVGGSLRAYLTWVGQQTAEGARVAETVLPETDDDAVRIMTIHAAKGLEFPITIVSGTSTVPQVRRSKAEVAFLPTGGVGYRFGSAVTTPEFAAWAPIDEQMAFDERVRLLYVACTRARDHLVVSLHRQARAVAPARPSRRTNAELLVDGMGDLLVEVPDADGDLDGDVVPARAPAPAHPEPFAEWSADRDRALAEAARPEVVSATGLLLDPPDPAVGPPAGPEPGPVDALADPGLDKGPRGQHDDDLVGRGRYGTAVGRAVHGVLQLVDLASGQGLDGAVTVQCRAEGVADEEVVRELALAALASPTVRQAGRSRHWREVLVATPLADGRLLEGYVDLLWRRDDGLVVVDYKTADTTDPAELSRRVARYRAQGAAYAYALEATTGERVAEVTFVFLTPTGPIELPLPDLAAAVAAVQAQAVGGAPVTAG